VLSQNAFLDALEEGRAALVILGDAVHSEAGRAVAGDGEFDAADGPDLPPHAAVSAAGVLSFAATMTPSPRTSSKDGIPQGLLWAKDLSPAARHGHTCKAMVEFYRLLPYVVVFRRFRRLPRGGAAQAEVSLDDAGEHPPPPLADPRADQQPPAAAEPAAGLPAAAR
jgi:hypothetical protein